MKMISTESDFLIDLMQFDGINDAVINKVINI